MTEQQKQFPEFYVTAPQPCPYLPERQERKVFTHLTHEKPTAVVDNLLKGGFRRSQNIAYMPYCDGCQACVSTRVLAGEFDFTRDRRRVLAKNDDLIARRRPPIATSEQYDLFRRYIDHRHGDGGMADMTVMDYAMMVEDSIVDTFITEYRLKTDTDARPGRNDQGALIGLSLCDRLSDGISMVYSFYDPLLTSRSLGTYMILDHIEYARAQKLDYVYLGYWIRGSRKMSYKTRFMPQEHLSSDGWQPAPKSDD
ncbi:MAG TPA: arginyltransferase [Hyphomicrobiaceae bacterium]|nr:arginyltransferase [Hyphomicrobiaceae bacterium]